MDRAQEYTKSVRFGDMFRIKKLDRGTGHDGGNGVLVNQLGLGIPAQQKAEIVEPGYDTLELYSVHKKYGDRYFLLAHMVEKRILEILSFFRGHLWPLLCLIPWGNPVGAGYAYDISRRELMPQ
jgi:hypothetical protein